MSKGTFPTITTTPAKAGVVIDMDIRAVSPIGAHEHFGTQNFSTIQHKSFFTGTDNGIYGTTVATVRKRQG
jgi:hypothetical protein